METMMKETLSIVVAAGTGSRFGGDVPKQFMELGGKPVVMYAIEAFRQAMPHGRIVLVLSASMMEYWEGLCDRYGFESPTVVCGGATRWESVKNALAAADDMPPHTVVMVHDGARPLVSGAVIRRVASCAVNTDGAIPAVEVADSMRMLDAGGIASVPVDRSLLRAVQTPQAFALWRLREAYKLPYQKEFTDDASVMAAAGFENVVLVEGERRNIKITTREDLVIAGALLHEGNA